MQASQDQDVPPPAPQQRQQDGDGAAVAATASGGRAEFKDLFVSLVDPAGLVDMDKCAETARRMGRVALESGYHAGARMSSILADIFADMADMASRRVDDGALHQTTIAFSHIMGVLYDTAEAYRDGKDREPVDKLERVRDVVARLVTEADKYREALKDADPQGSALPGIDTPYKGKICMDVIRKEQEEVRAQEREWGHDPIFPPKPKPFDEFRGDNYDPNISSADMVAAIRGGGPPEGYEVVKIESQGWKGRTPASIS